MLPEKPFFTPEQEQMILRTFLGGASKQEAEVLLATVRRRKLDPFSRQVYFVKRYDTQKRMEVWAIQTSIDGLRSIAERSGKYNGQSEPEYGSDEYGEFCKVRVYRKDWPAEHAAVGIAYYEEFVQKTREGKVTHFWFKMKRLMLAKCAEALGIRKAFPEETGGLYISEEFGTPDTEVDVTPSEERKGSKGGVLADVAEKLGAETKALPERRLVPTPPAQGQGKPGLATARAKLKWNRDHPDKKKTLTEGEVKLLMDSGEGPAVEQPQETIPETPAIEHDEMVDELNREAEEAERGE